MNKPLTLSRPIRKTTRVSGLMQPTTKFGYLRSFWYWFKITWSKRNESGAGRILRSRFTLEDFYGGFVVHGISLANVKGMARRG